MNQSTDHQGKIVQVVSYDVQLPNGKVKRFEKAMRAPGVRLIIQDELNKILLNKERRHELGGYDLRLPGGKVIDTLEEYNKFLNSNDSIEDRVLQAAVREGKEEVGLEISRESKIYCKKTCGATMEWDLRYVLVRDHNVHEDGTDFGSGEIIDGYKRYSYDKVLKLIANGEIKEARTAGVLAEYILGEIL